MNLFEKTNIVLHSGGSTDFKIECDALTDEDIETIAYLISKKFNFRKVSGVPTGGIRLRDALRKYTSDEGYHVLIVDDVLTTGNSMERHRECNVLIFEECVGVVIFARGKCPDWVHPIFQMWEEK